MQLRAIATRQAQSRASILDEYFVDPIVRRLKKAPVWTAPGYGARSDMGELLASRGDRSRDASLVNRRLYFDVRWGNVKLVLNYTDKSAMAHSVEARVPYFDRALVELAFSLPDHHKVGAGDRKRILRDAARRRLPPQITERADRMGFATPDHEMLRGALWPVVREALGNGFLSSPCFDSRAVERFLSDFENRRHEDARGVWRLYALARGGTRST